jgi:GntR family transcriptional regulator, transcriptional repressor for pyruvate dehydrogenase complex
MTATKIKQKTVVEQVMEKIRDLISSGQYKIGDKLPTENELAERFGIGRSSIREAIKVFNYLGILESRTAKGTFVCDKTSISSEAVTWAILLGKNDLFEVVELRGAIELSSLITLTEKYKDSPEETIPTLERMKQELGNITSSIENNFMEDLVQADYNFHYSIISGSKNKLFVSIYELIRSFMFEEIKKTYKDLDNLSFLIEEHTAFIAAVETGDIAHAQDIIREHIGIIKTKLIRQLPVQETAVAEI